jgi:hypothetical protein
MEHNLHDQVAASIDHHPGATVPLRIGHAVARQSLSVEV